MYKIVIDTLYSVQSQFLIIYTMKYTFFSMCFVPSLMSTAVLVLFNVILVSILFRIDNQSSPIAIQWKLHFLGSFNKVTLFPVFGEYLFFPV